MARLFRKQEAATMAVVAASLSENPIRVTA